MGNFDPPEPPDEVDEDQILCLCGSTKEEHKPCTEEEDCDALHCPNDTSGENEFQEMTEQDIKEEKLLRRWEQDREEGLA